jgi:hypothetical protein
LSEEQRKSKRWYKNWWNYFFILIFILFIAALCVMSIGGSLTPSRESVYSHNQKSLQDAVKDYQNRNDGALPTVNGTVTVNGSLCHIIDVCALLVPEGGKLNQVPDTCTSINGSNNDNCDAGCEGCWEYSHYIWVVDESGNVYSTCVGSDCIAYNADGYQSVYP